MVRKTLLALVLLLLIHAAAAQSIVNLSASQCLWHPGDDIAWSASSLDETGWQPYREWKRQPGIPNLWIRCHPDLRPLSGDTHPAFQVSFTSAYQVFMNGNFLGGEGNLARGESSVDSIRNYPLNSSLLAAPQSTIAFRVTERGAVAVIGPIIRLLQSPLEMRAGDAEILSAIRAKTVLSRVSSFLETSICFAVVGVLAFMLIGLFSHDRSRRELLLLSLTCLSLAVLRVNELCAAACFRYPITTCYAIILIANLALTFSQIPFFFALAGRRTPTLFRILIGAVALGYLPLTLDILLAAHHPSWLDAYSNPIFRPYSLLIHAAISFAPFVAFRHIRRVVPGIRPIAALCMFWGFADLIWFVVELTGLPIPGVPNLFAQWGLVLLEIRAFTTACVLVALLGLLFREQRQVTQERAAMAGELHAAGEIQRMLAPATLETAPGLHIEVAFHPMREVGGDFYMCRVLPDGRQRVLVGDVSGKGTAAAMAAALLLGGAAARDQDSPAGLLTHLNRVLLESRVGGFATCLCADIGRDGSILVANAGHLSPYVAGREVELENGLPLGVDVRADYPETAVSIAPGLQLTLLTDGIVEARNSTGELFGFERAANISTRSADEIAAAAQSFGHEDDITVLTLALV